MVFHIQSKLFCMLQFLFLHSVKCLRYWQYCYFLSCLLPENSSVLFCRLDITVGRCRGIDSWQQGDSLPLQLPDFCGVAIFESACKHFSFVADCKFQASSKVNVLSSLLSKMSKENNIANIVVNILQKSTPWLILILKMKDSYQIPLHAYLSFFVLIGNKTLDERFYPHFRLGLQY